MKKVQLNLNKLVKLLTNFLQFPGTPVALESNTNAAFAKMSKKNKIQYNTAYSVQSVTNIAIFDKVIAKIKRCSFLPHSV